MTDFDVHGLVGVRVVGDAADADLVGRQLGPLRGELTTAPDIVIEFVDRVETGPLVFLGRNEWAHDDESLIVLRGKGKSSIRARVPLDTIGSGCRLVVERGAPNVPFLVPLVNLCVLANGGLPLHAAAFEMDGVGVVVTGWSKGGKTESLLAALDGGARYVGDEWVYLDRDGTRAVGVPEPVRVWDWYVDQLDRTRPRSTAADRLRAGSLRGLVSIAERAESAPIGGAGQRLARRVGHLADGQRHSDLPVSALTGAAAAPESIDVDVVVHTISVDRGDYDLRRIEGGEVAARMAGSLAFERLPLMSLYHAARYAFPERRSELIEAAGDIERHRLVDFLGSRHCWESSHPYPPDLADLRGSLSRLWTT